MMGKRALESRAIADSYELRQAVLRSLMRLLFESHDREFQRQVTALPSESSPARSCIS